MPRFERGRAVDVTGLNDPALHAHVDHLTGNFVLQGEVGLGSDELPRGTRLKRPNEGNKRPSYLRLLMADARQADIVEQHSSTIGPGLHDTPEVPAMFEGSLVGPAPLEQVAPHLVAADLGLVALPGAMVPRQITEFPPQPNL